MSIRDLEEGQKDYKGIFSDVLEKIKKGEIILEEAEEEDEEEELE